MTSRRAFLSGILASSVLPLSGWAQAGSPSFLSAAQHRDGHYLLCGLSDQGEVLFEIPLPDRGHAAAAHPSKPHAVAFARRPGRFAIVIDCSKGTPIAELVAPQGRHFYGHGTYNADGTLLFTTENDYEAARGIVGVWDVTAGYQRVNEFSSGGIGPHDIQLIPEGETMVVANGGIETHPSTGRAKLNISEMAPNLTYLNLDGAVIEQACMDAKLSRNSIRHLSVAKDGLIAMGMQWQGDIHEDVPLVATHRMGEDIRPMQMKAGLSTLMEGYVGSVAVSEDGQNIAATSPRGGILVSFDNGNQSGVQEFEDVSGVASNVQTMMMTSGSGVIRTQTGVLSHHSDLRWDNHLVSIDTHAYQLTQR
jgi:hypothetical protein